MSLPAYLRMQKDGLHLAVRVQPRASANEIQGELNGELKVRLTAPPVDSAANEALVEFIAEALGCPRNAVQLVRGQTARHKLLRILGVAPELAAAKLSGG